MADTTDPAGLPFPEPDDPNDVPADLQALAERTAGLLGAVPVTVEERDALAGADLWPGRLVTNTTTGLVEVWAGGEWASVGLRDHAALDGLDADDHEQYALADGTRGAFAAPDHDHDNRYQRTPTNWTNLSGPSGWITPPSDVPNVQQRLNGEIVELRGARRWTNRDQLTPFNLPAFRLPSAERWFPCVALPSLSPNSPVTAYVRISPDGATVRLAGGGEALVFFDGVRYSL